MLALSTTRATITGSRGPEAEDDHGTPVPAPAVSLGNYPAHRRAGATVLTAAGDQVRGAVWWLAAEAWPLELGDVITDDTDGTVWVVESAQLVPARLLGLEQVRAECTQQGA